MDVKKIEETQKRIEAILKEHKEMTYVQLTFADLEDPVYDLCLTSVGFEMSPDYIIEYSFLHFLRIVIGLYRAAAMTFAETKIEKSIFDELKGLVNIFVMQFNQIHRIDELDSKDLLNMSDDDIKEYIFRERNGGGATSDE